MGYEFNSQISQTVLELDMIPLMHSALPQNMLQSYRIYFHRSHFIFSVRQC